jgi:serine/threonine protein kinase
MVKLLDLGVIRPIDLSSITDLGDQKIFVGTLQYSSPELLFREEHPTVEGWRAVTFYQLGGVLHDLLMRVPLFQSYSNPYPRLVMAVKEVVPVIEGADLPQDLRLLAQNCLHKSPTYRLSTVTWEDFDKPEVQGSLENARLAIKQRRAKSSQQKDPLNLEDLASQQLFSLRTAIFNAAVHTCGREGLPRYSHVYHEDSKSSRLTLTFAPSDHLGIVCWISIIIRGVILDPAANIHHVSIWALLANEKPEIPVDTDSVAPTLELQGVLIEKDVADFVERGLLLSFANNRLSEAISPGINWIDLGGGL